MGPLFFAAGSAEDHDGTADDAQITQEEIGIEDEAASEALNDDYDEKTSNSIFRIMFRGDGAKANGHGLWSVMSCKEI